MRLQLPKTVTAVQNHVPSPVFNVVIAYEDFDSGRRAMDACKLLVAQVGDEVQVRSSMWKFDVLEVMKLSEIAIHDAVEADMIIVATAQNSDLPGPVRTWVESWVPEKRGQSAALLALMDLANGEEPTPVRAYLRKAAAAAGIDFLQQSDPRSEGNWKPPTAMPLGNAVLLPRMVSRPAPEGWGLND